jgi:MFS family permease
MQGFLGYSRDFWLLCISSMFFFGSFNMVIPELPNYLTSIGGGEYKNWIIASFSLVALISRPFSGKITDSVGRLPVMVFGALICALTGFLYIFITGVTLFFVLRAVHGLSAGFTPTGNVAYIGDIVSAERRGEAMGWMGMAGNIGAAMGPSLGGFIVLHLGIHALFISSSIMGFLSLVIFLKMKETLVPTERLNLSHFKIKVQDFWEPSVRRVSMVMALSVFSFGTILTVIPDLSVHLGIENKGYFFTIFTLSSLLTRLLAGKASDRYGREPLVRIGCVLLAISMFSLSLTETAFMLVFSAVLMGLAQGVISPTLFAWASDLSPAHAKGRSMATLYIALELGVSVGAYISGTVYANKISNLFWAFNLCTSFAIIALLYLLIFKPKYYI